MIILDNITISPIHQKDAWSICDLMVANEDRFKHYFPGTLAQNLNPTLSNRFVDQKINAFANKEEYVFTLKENASKELIGLVYIKELDWDKKQGEFAYCIGYNSEGKGYTSTAIKTLSKHAFENLGLEILQIIAHKDNIPSIKVAEKCNYEWVKTLANEFKPIGRDPLDMELYELYKHEI